MRVLIWPVHSESHYIIEYIMAMSRLCAFSLISILPLCRCLRCECTVGTRLTTRHNPGYCKGKRKKKANGPLHESIPLRMKSIFHT